MTAPEIFNPDFLRPLAHVSEPDPRNLAFIRVDPDTKNCRPIEIKDFHQEVSTLQLNSTVPQKITSAFETAKNLYLYAWFVYRFHPVAEHQALACLELALRKQYECELQEEDPDGRKPTLSPLLRYAIKHGHITPGGFRRWHEAAQRRALRRYEMEKIDEMYAKELKQIDLDYSDVTMTDADRNGEFLNFLADSLPKLRNEYAHGTAMIHNQALMTLEIVSEIINQIYTSE
ncbi:MAG: hypothetical protein AB7H03_12560 [Nitrospirales bacterium]